MHLVTTLVSCLVIIQSLTQSVCLAWKPIVGSSSFSTSFSLQQSHPDLAAKSSYRVNPQDNLEIPAVTLVQDRLKSDHIAAVPIPIPIPVTYSFGEEHIGYDYAGENRDIAENSNIFGLTGGNTCAVKKFAFNHDGTAHYDNDLPEMNQFSICFWMRFTNHSGDHVILTYSVKAEPREIQFWIANAKNSSFISMAIKGQQVYRLNYPLRVRKWHHICSSWNGKTGEWQSWLKAERIGRGFHNSLVGHKIPANGKLYSGGPSITGDVMNGLHFEVTLVQVYRIALSAGKAHRDHKHHHAHHFDHEGQELSTTTKQPAIINRPLPMHNLLANGQIPTRVRINLANPVQTQNVQTAQILNAKPIIDGTHDNHAFTINTNFVNGQINSGSRLVAQQLIGLAAGPNLLTDNTQTTLDGQHNPADVQYIDESETRIIFKRHSNWNSTKPELKSKSSTKLKNVKKRGLVLLKDGSVFDDALIDVSNKYEGLAEFGGQQFKTDLTVKMNVEDEIATHDREPAEEEVKAVMALCGSCDIEPFQGAIVFAWKNVKEELNNALKGLSVGRCENF